MELSSQLTSTNPFEATQATSQAQGELTSTLRSFRDSLSFSLQTLNLTLSSMSQTMMNVGNKIGGAMTAGVTPLAPFGIHSQWIPRSPGGLYTGSLSQAYQQFSGSNNLSGLLFASQQYNINPNEFWLERKTDTATRLSSAGIATGAALLQEGVGLAAGSAAGGAIGGALGLGSGMLGGIGRFALGVPFGMLGGAAIGFLADPIVNAAVQHNKDTAAMMRMSARFRSPFSMREAQRAVTGIEDLAYRELFNTTRMDTRLNMSGFRDIAMMGLQSNMFHGTTPEQLVQQVSSASNVVKFLTGVLGSKDVQETMQVVKQFKDMGLNSFQNFSTIQAIGNDAFSYGRSLGVQASSLLSAAASMSSVAFGQHGNPAFVGMQPAIRNIAFTTELEKRNMLTPAEIAAGGGVQAISGRMLSTQANLLNNGAIGGAMLYAGWNGATGFNLDQYKNVIGSGGYWGSLGLAARNITQGGIGGIARSIIDKNNIIASAAKNGNLDELLEIQLRQALETGTNILPANASIEDKVAMGAVMLMQMNPGTDTSTAKAIAMKVFNPRVQATVDRRAREQYAMGRMEFSRSNRGFGRVLDSVGETVERNLSAVHNTIIQRPGRFLADTASNAMDFSYRTQGAGAQVLNTIQDFDVYAGMYADTLSNPYLDNTTGKYTNKERLAAINRLDKRDTLSDAILGLGMGASRFSSRLSSYFGTEDPSSAGAMKDYNFLMDSESLGAQFYAASFWNKVASDRPTTIEAYNTIRPYIKDSITDADLKRIFSKRSNLNSMAPMLAAGDLYDEGATNDTRKVANGRIKYITDDLSMDDVRAVLGNSVQLDSSLSTNEAFQLVASSDARDRAAQLAKQKGVSTDTMMAAIVQKGFGKGDVSGIVGAIASGQYDKFLKTAAGYSPLDYLQQNTGREDIPGIAVNNVADAQYLSNIGLDPNQMDEVFKEFKSSKDANRFIDAYAKAVNGEMPDDVEGLGKTALSILENAKKDYEGSFFKRRTHIDTNIAKARLKSYGSHRAAENLDMRMADLGISGLSTETALKMSNEDAKKFFEAGGFTANNKEAQALVDRVNQLKGMSNEELENAIHAKKGSITDENRWTTLLKASYVGFDKAGSMEEQTANNTLHVKKTAVDTAVEEGTGGRNYIRVRIIDKNEVADTRKQVDASTSNKQKNQGTNADQLSVWGQLKNDFHNFWSRQ